MIQTLKHELEQFFSKELVDHLIEEYLDQARSFFLGHYRPSELEAGRFVEVVLRMLEEVANGRGNYTPLNKRIKFDDNTLKRLENLDPNIHESFRIHIPRLLRAIYDIRNRRNVGHVKGDINPNLADSLLVFVACKWVIVELLRLCFRSSLEQAQKLADSIIKVPLPIVEDFDGFLKVLDPSLNAKEKILVLLYYRHPDGAGESQLFTWIGYSNKSRLLRYISELDKEAYIHRDETGVCHITKRGIQAVQDILSSRNVAIMKPGLKPAWLNHGGSA